MMEISRTDCTGLVEVGASIGSPSALEGSSSMAGHIVSVLFVTATSMGSASHSSLKNSKEEDVEEKIFLRAISSTSTSFVSKSMNARSKY